MQAAVYTQYGTPDVVTLKEVARPVPAANELLVRVSATTVSAGDWRMRAGEPFAIKVYNGLPRPKRTILGHEFAGVVETVGSDVTRFKVGDRIFGSVGNAAGTHAEFVCIPDSATVTLTPQNISDETAAALPTGAMTALYFMRRAKVAPGKKVLIYGASGSVGTYAVQLAKHFGAEVTAVCSTANIELMQTLGADNIIDYTLRDYTQGPDIYDIIFDAVGRDSYAKGRKVLHPNGLFLTVAMDVGRLVQSAVAAISGNQRLITAISAGSSEDLEFLAQLVVNGELRPVIDRSVPFSEIVEAHRIAQGGHKKGNLVVTLA